MSDRASDLRRRQLRARQLAAQTDSMGFPVAAQGGVSSDSVAIREFQGKGKAALLGAADGMTLGLSDEINGVVGAGLGALGANDSYEASRDRARGAQDMARAENPLSFGGGQAVGALAPAVATFGIATGPSVLGNMGRGAAIGAAEGGLYGFGSGEGGADRAEGAAFGALMGAGVGGAAPGVIHGGAAVKDAIRDPATGVIDVLTGRANAGKANRAIAETMRASGKTPDQLRDMIATATREGQPEYRLMDAMVGVAGQRRASGIARAGGDAATEIAEYLSKRQSGQGDRVRDIVHDGFGFGVTPTGNTLPAIPGSPAQAGQVLAGKQATAVQTEAALKEARGASADKAYSAARGNAAPVDVRGAVGVIDARIGGMKGSNIKGDGIDAKLSRYRDRLAADPAPDGEISRELSDFNRALGVKQDVQDDIGAALRAGRNNEARELQKLVAELDAALENSSDMYRAANDGYREASKVIGAIEGRCWNVQRWARTRQRAGVSNP